jgi:hypothetical protein
VAGALPLGDRLNIESLDAHGEYPPLTLTKAPNDRGSELTQLVAVLAASELSLRGGSLIDHTAECGAFVLLAALAASAMAVVAQAIAHRDAEERVHLVLALCPARDERSLQGFLERILDPVPPEVAVPARELRTQPRPGRSCCDPLD